MHARIGKDSLSNRTDKEIDGAIYLEMESRDGRAEPTSFMMTILLRAAVLPAKCVSGGSGSVWTENYWRTALCLTITMMSLSEHQRESVSRLITHWSLIQATVHLVASSSFHGPISPIKAKNFKADFPLQYKEGWGCQRLRI